jgi:MYXO-CTERM domain-containing protein
MRGLALGLMVALGGCSAQTAPLPSGPLARTVALSADHNGVPRALMLAVGVVEGGLALSRVRLPDSDDHVPVAGVLELRHGAFDSLARGAALMGSDELTLRADTDLGTEAGARVLAELGRDSGARVDDLASWRDALEKLSGMSDYTSRTRYAEDVFTILRAGGEFPAREGETITIAAHPDLVVARQGVFVEAATAQLTVEFPGAIAFPTNCSGKCDTTRTAGTAVVNMIAIHDTEGGWNASVATLQNDAGKSVHYIVDADGSRVGQFVPESYTAWHVGNYFYNQRMVGIEHVGVASDPAGYATPLYDKSVELVKNIRTRWSVPLDRAHIIGHYQVPNGNAIAQDSQYCTDTLNNCETSANYGGANNHRDPGYNWQWCQYMQKLGGSCTCNDTYPLWNCTTDKTEAFRCVNGKVEGMACTAGCVSQAVGKDDICNVKPGGGGGSGGGGGGGSGGSGGATGVARGDVLAGSFDAPKGDNPGGPTVSSHSGCSVGNFSTGTTGAAWLLLGAALVLTLRRRATKVSSARPALR